MLHKQKFYCQVCEKACKDENGYKVHCKTPGHISKIKVMSEDSDFYLNSYSRQFQDQFLRFLRLKGMSGDTFCSSNLYQEFIKDTPNHIHLNATRWTKLTNFLYSLEAGGYLKILGFSDFGKSTIKLTKKLVGNNNFNVEEINNKFNKKEKLIKEEFEEYDKIVGKCVLNLKEDANLKQIIKHDEINVSIGDEIENNDKINTNKEIEEQKNITLEEETNVISNNTFLLKKPIVRRKLLDDCDLIGSKKYNSNINSLNSLIISASNVLK